MASIVDKPKGSTQNDLLEIERYTDGLIKFIETSATPITIGIQGEWGSGKTSLLNTIKNSLCDEEGAQHYSVWLNTWEYSLLSSPDETLIKIIVGLIDQIGTLTKKRSEESFKKVLSIGRGLLSKATEAGGILGVAAGIANDAVNSEVQDNSIGALRASLQVVIDKAIESSDKRAFVFYIDDLDRLEPAVAVSILELIKNLFDLKHCIFVLAIDYGVVIKGLQSKFGKMTEENEWEFRAFFDKIIQLPFSMPLSSYNISKYLQSLLVDVGYFQKSELEDQNTLNKISEIVSLSVGTNPRALKRLANSVSLIEIIRGDQKISKDERIVEFALICMQIAYPFLYSLVQRNSDFTNWDDKIVYDVLKNKKIDESDLEILKTSEEFDEVWEQNLWKICQVNSFLRQKVFFISKLLNFIKDNIPDVKGEEMEDTLDRLLSMSSVTSVSVESVSTTTKEKFQKIKYDGWENYVEILKERKISENIIALLKELIDEITNELGENIEIVYSPSVISIKNKNIIGRKKVFVYIGVRKSKIQLEFTIITEKLKSGYANTEYNEKQNSYGATLEKENNFNCKQYLPLLVELYNELEKSQ